MDVRKQDPRQEPQHTSDGHTFRAPYTEWVQDPPVDGGDADVLRELETQLRAFGSSIADGLQYGFSGRGPELDSRARNLGYAVTDAVHYGVRRGRQAFNEARARQNAGQPLWQGQFFGPRKQPDWLRRFYQARLGMGLTLTITGGIFLFGLWLGGLICAGVGLASGWAESTVVGVALLLAGLPFVWMTIRGVQHLMAYNRLKAYAAVVGSQTQVPLDMLAQTAQRSKKDVVRDLRKMIQRNWLVAWLDEEAGMLYLTQQAYAAAREKQQMAGAQAEAEKQTPPAPDAADAQTLDSIRQFITLLERQQQLMRENPQAAEEMAQMVRTSRAILAWLEQHPESMPKARRLAGYYIPTTCKLLRTYNELRAQDGDNAQSIRRDIAGMLHTLNTALCNLHDNLLSDVALDVSSEIAALQGMLARDGLAEDPFDSRKQTKA